MKSVKVENDRCTITIDPNGRMRREHEIDLIFDKKDQTGRNVITVTEEDLDTLVRAIKKYKSQNWWTLHERKKQNGNSTRI